MTKLAAQYGVSLATISLIIAGKIWAHLLPSDRGSRIFRINRGARQAKFNF
jgi:hypothetical protein